MRIKKEHERTVSRELTAEVPVAGLEHAPWNPRSEHDLDADNPEMKKLVASVKARGVVQPVAAWRDSAGRLVVIAGNRRLAAARIAGLSTIPAMIFNGISEADAREITRIENEVRLGVSPIRDSELICTMIDRYGYSQREAAAHFGVPESTIARRVMLRNLNAAIRSAAEETGAFTADALERMALYPPEVQSRLADSVGRVARCCKSGETIKWKLLESSFLRETRDLDKATFDTSRCERCAKRTGVQPDLWGDVPEGSVGRCLDVECWEKNLRRGIRDAALALAGEGFKSSDLIDGDAEGLTRWEAENDTAFSKEATAAAPCPWWWENYDGSVKVLFGPSVSAWRDMRDSRETASRAESAARAERAKLAQAVQAAECQIYDAIDAAGLDVSDPDSSALAAVGAALFGRNLDRRERTAVRFVFNGIANISDCGWDANSIPLLADFLRAYPAVAEAVGVSKDMIDAYDAAVEKRNAFDAAAESAE